MIYVETVPNSACYNFLSLSSRCSSLLSRILCKRCQNYKEVINRKEITENPNYFAAAIFFSQLEVKSIQ